MLIFKLDRELFQDWNPRHSFVEKLSRRLSVEVSDFYMGLETGFFLRKDKECYSGRTVSKEALRAVLFEAGIGDDEFLRSESLGTRSTLSGYAERLTVPLSCLIRLSESGAEDKRAMYTDISAGYYSMALDAAVLTFLYLSRTVSVPVSYLDSGLGDYGWNPTLSSLNSIAFSSGLSIGTLCRYGKAVDGIVSIDTSVEGYEPVTRERVREELFFLFGTRDISVIARRAGEEYDKTYQHLRRNGERSMTVLSLLGYLEVLNMTLPEFFRLCQERT